MTDGTRALVAQKGCKMDTQKTQASCWRDLFDPGWREREAERWNSAGTNGCTGATMSDSDQPLGVTVDDALPPIPKAAHMRRSHRAHGGYEMVPAYTVAELKAFAHEAIKRDRLERDGDLRGVHGPLPETGWD